MRRGKGLVTDEAAQDDAAPQALTADPQVPEPRGLSTYIQILGEWTRGTVSEPFLLGLITSLGFGASERTEFAAGADQLWGLVPPIDAPDVAEAELEPVAARALALALCLRGTHALHHYLPPPAGTSAPTPRVLNSVAELITVIHLILEGHGDEGSPAARRLGQLQKQLAARGVDTSRLADRKEDVRDAVLARRRAEEEAERNRKESEDREVEEAHARLLKRGRTRTDVPIKGLLFMGASFVAAFFIHNSLTPAPSGGLPPATSYTEVPVSGIVRHPDVIFVRVQETWIQEGEAERKVAAQRLFDRLSKESGGDVAKLVLQTPSGGELAVVTANSVKWRGPLVTPALPKKPIKEGSGQ